MPLITQSARMLEMVARHGSIRRAAERVNAVPSAINRQILNLEAELGMALFERLPRGMRLTEAGSILVAQVRSWQRDHELTLAAVRGLKGRKGGLVRVGIMECLAAEFLPGVFAELHQNHPDATIRAVVGGTSDLVSQLNADELDIAIAFNMPRDMGLKIVHEIRMEMGAIMSPQHPLAGEREIPLKSLLDHPLVLADSTLTVGPIVSAIVERSRQPARQTVVTNSITVLKSMVMQGLGVGILTPIDVFAERRTGQLHFTPIAGTRMVQPLSVAVRDVRALNPSAKRMVGLVSGALDRLGAV